jgi:hypothetical protein
MTAIFVMPDAEYFEKDQPLVFEVPGELHRAAMDTSLPDETRRAAFGRIYQEFGVPAVLQEISHPHRDLFEIIDDHPVAMLPHETQENPGDIVERTVMGVPKSAIDKSTARGTIFWKIIVRTKQKRRLYERYREVKGPKDGFEANDEMPEEFAHKQLVYDLKKDK